MKHKVVLGVVGAIVIALAAVALLGPRRGSALSERERALLDSIPDASTPGSTSSEDDLRRILTTDKPGDDTARRFAMKTLIEPRRCDHISSLVRRADGKWTVACQAGYVYRVWLARDGKVYVEQF
jgi:hypothetical protein